MATDIKIKRGTQAQLPTLGLAEPGFTTDTKRLYIGDGVGNVQIGGSGDVDYSFLDLSDSPTTYSGNAGKLIKVSDDATGLSFFPLSTVLSGSSSYYDAYDSSGGLILTPAWKDVSFDSVRQSSGDFSINNATEITFNKEGHYYISGRVTVNQPSGSVRSECKMRLLYDTGSGYQEVPGSLAYVYSRNNTQGAGTANVGILEYVEEGVKYKVQAAVESGSSAIQLLPNGSAITVFTLGAGTKGEDGAPGQDGAPGAGSTIILKDEGVAISGTPHSVFNFVGDRLSVSDNGDGSVDIEVTNISVFGTEVYWEVDDGTSSTNSSSFRNKVTLNVYDVPAGTYKISWFFEWSMDDEKDFNSRVVLDSTTELMGQEKEPAKKDKWDSDCGFAISSLSSGDHSIELDYAASNSKTASIRKARLELWRMS